MPRSLPAKKEQSREAQRRFRRMRTPQNLQAAADALNELNHPSQSTIRATGSAEHFLSSQETKAAKEGGSRSKRSRSDGAGSNETQASSSYYVDASIHKDVAAPADSLTPDTSAIPGKEEVLATFQNSRRELDNSSWAVDSPNSSTALDPNSSLTAPSDVSLIVPHSLNPGTSFTKDGQLNETLPADEFQSSRTQATHTRDDDVASVSASWDNRSSVIERTPSRGHSTTPSSSPQKTDFRDAETWKEPDEWDTSFNLEPDSNQTIASGSDVTLVDVRVSSQQKGLFEELGEEKDVLELTDEEQEPHHGVAPDTQRQAFIPETPSPKNKVVSTSWFLDELDSSDMSLNLEPDSGMIMAVDDIDITAIGTPNTSLDMNNSYQAADESQETTLLAKPVDKSSLYKTRSVKKVSETNSNFSGLLG
ncbi:hypothetical protein RvY_09919 [Ramazzottius varieornatus]|uniref:Uncharacterized protein n=1 Tax=Ramazzottius varieornatus TaxID=947166 RepID=A0A1D1VB26_RAMVA|nr:hypothetical protein RvY_09919 [Ramazzottius varieornatus]